MNLTFTGYFYFMYFFLKLPNVYIFDNTHLFVRNLRLDILYYYEIGKNIVVSKLMPYRDFNLEYPVIWFNEITIKINFVGTTFADYLQQT